MNPSCCAGSRARSARSNGSASGARPGATLPRCRAAGARRWRRRACLMSSLTHCDIQHCAWASFRRAGAHRRGVARHQQLDDRTALQRVHFGRRRRTRAPRGRASGVSASRAALNRRVTLTAKRGRPPRPMPEGVARVEYGRHEIRYWGAGWPEELGPTFIILKKPSKKSRRTTKNGRRGSAQVPAPSDRNGGPRGAWQGA